MTLNFVLGTAAELIKVYPVIHLALERGAPVRVLMTGQSRENFLMQYRDFNLPEDILFALRSGQSDLFKASSAMRWFFRSLIIQPRHFRNKLLTVPNQKTVVLVHGDTLSSLLGSFLAWRSDVMVAHVEAGLRSPRLLNPFPEEITRRLVSYFARIHFAPDEHAEQNLLAARVRGEIINTHGNTLLDAVLLSEKLKATHAPRGPAFALANIHRFENLNSTARWRKILSVVEASAEHLPLIFVAHPQTLHKLRTDPTTQNVFKHPKIEVRERVAFSQFISLLKNAEYLLSDGGSNQEECSYLGKPCLLLREATERLEGLDTCCVLSKFDMSVISRFLENPQQYALKSPNRPQSPAKVIVERLLD